MSEANTEKTLVIFKPDAVKRKLCFRFLKTWESKGYEITQIRIHQATREEMVQHYAEHVGKDFFPALLARMTTGKAMFIVFSGPSVVRWSRRAIGSTDPLEADVNTLRGTFAQSVQHNLVHASDSLESAAREIDIWFPKVNA